MGTPDSNLERRFFEHSILHRCAFVCLASASAAIKLGLIGIFISSIAGCHWISGSITSETMNSTSPTVSLCLGSEESSGFQSGSGTSDSPYIVCNAAQWNKIGLDQTLWTKSFKLGQNLDFSSLTSYNPIGTALAPFTGSVDGGSFTMSNLTYDGGGSKAGLISIVGAGAVFSNLTIQNFQITSTNVAGGLIGEGDINAGITLSKITAKSPHVGGVTTNYAGGVIGASYGHLQMSDIVVTGAIIGGTSVHSGGGVVGRWGPQSAGTSNVSNSSIEVSSFASITSNTGGFAGTISGTAGTFVISNVSISILSTQSTGSYGGGFAGEISTNNGSFTATSVQISANLSSAGTRIGGFAGTVNVPSGSVSLASLSFNGSLSTSAASGNLGGLLGYLNAASGGITIQRSYANATLTNSSGGLGPTAGLVAYDNSVGGNHSIVDSYARGNITTNNTAGGIFGYLFTRPWALQRSYYAGTITATSNMRCIRPSVGFSTLTATDVTYDVTTCTVGEPLGGVTPRATGAIQTATPFTNWLSTVWVFVNAQYPTLL